MSYLLGDIGRTKLRLAWAETLDKFNEPIILNTPPNFDAVINLIVEESAKFLGGKKLDQAVIGVTRKIASTEDLVAALSPKLGVPVKAENDAALGALGEAVAGSGKGHKIVVYYTVSTGVGGARVVDGKIDRSAFGFEPGHQVIDAGRSLCPDCPGPFLEDYISGAAVEKQKGMKPFEINDNEFWQQMARFLAQGLVNTCVHWSPDVIVLGGSMMKKPGIAVEEVASYLHSLLPPFYPPPKVVAAMLGDVVGLHGALALLRETYQH